MDNFALVMSFLCKIVERNKKCSINVTTVGNQIKVNILTGKFWKRRKRFQGTASDFLMSDIRYY